MKSAKVYFVDTIIFWKLAFAFLKVHVFSNSMTNKCFRNAKASFQNIIVSTKYTFALFIFMLVFINPN